MGVEGIDGLTATGSVTHDDMRTVADKAELAPTDLTVVIVSFNDAHWLEDCLRSLEQRSGEIAVEIVIVDNGSDGAFEMVRERFPKVRAIKTDNLGFANGNNVGVMSGAGRYVLFLNPDTALVDGSLASLVAELDQRPQVGLAGVRQLTGDGTLWPTIRYFPNAMRALGDALGCERWPRRPSWAGERELDLGRYGQEVDCDWTSGSFMVVRREALLSAGLFDERFFLFSEEPDLCLRIKRAGWSVRHLPTVTIVHHAGKSGPTPRLTAQIAFARKQYAHKHFGLSHRCGYLSAVACGHLLRAGVLSRKPVSASRAGARLALRTLAGLAEPPYGPPPSAALCRPVRGST
jgi:N-acetylglucosaminyl-diphospho-decaprenol L-rhamnosyltransferase